MSRYNVRFNCAPVVAAVLLRKYNLIVYQCVKEEQKEEVTKTVRNIKRQPKPNIIE